METSTFCSPERVLGGSLQPMDESDNQSDNSEEEDAMRIFAEIDIIPNEFDTNWTKKLPVWTSPEAFANKVVTFAFSSPVRIGTGDDERFSHDINSEMFLNKIEGHLHRKAESAIQIVDSSMELDAAFNRVLMLRETTPKFMPKTWYILDPVETILLWTIKVWFSVWGM